MSNRSPKGHTIFRIVGCLIKARLGRSKQGAPFYQKADHVIVTQDKMLEDVCEEILKVMENG